MKTASGRLIDPFNLKPEDIDITDIAHSLSHQCRFLGHTSKFYSVAQHSVYVSSLCKFYPLAGLLHDASEAYLCDVPRPLKRTPEMAAYRALEKKVQGVILTKYGLSPDLPDEVHIADNQMLVTEGIQLMNEFYSELGTPADILIRPVTPEKAKEYFLAEYRCLLLIKARPDLDPLPYQIATGKDDTMH